MMTSWSPRHVQQDKTILQEKTTQHPSYCATDNKTDIKTLDTHRQSQYGKRKRGGTPG